MFIAMSEALNIKRQDAFLVCLPNEIGEQLLVEAYGSETRQTRGTAHVLVDVIASGTMLVAVALTPAATRRTAELILGWCDQIEARERPRIEIHIGKDRRVLHSKYSGGIDELANVIQEAIDAWVPN